MLRYAIVDATCTFAQTQRLASNGIDFIQLRAKHLPAGHLATLARRILSDIASIPNSPTKLLVNTRPDVALATNAHGVHLTSSPNELTPTQIRALYQRSPEPWTLGPELCLTSISCHTLEDVHRAHTLAADLILFGPIFEKRVARQFIRDGSGLAALEAAVQAAQGTPILALGGITEQNTAACLNAGAAGIAAIRLFA